MSKDNPGVPEQESGNTSQESSPANKIEEGSSISTADLAHNDPQADTMAVPTRPTRTSTAWAALFVGMLVLIVILVFILENLATVKIGFFGEHLKLPLAVALLLAAILGGLVVFLLGSIRILQLRQTVRRHHRAHTAS